MTDKKKESTFKKYLPRFTSPTAIGIYITFILSFAAFNFYKLKDTVREPGGLLKFVIDADQKSIDYRLKFRGIRPASDRVAVLAIDDRSIDLVGRWPWPRDTLAIAINNAFENGASVIASDIVWSEPSDRPEVKLFQKLSNKNQLPENLKQIVDKEIAEGDPDKIFGEYIEKNKSGFIVGNFFSNVSSWQMADTYSGYQSACHDLIFKGDPLLNILDRQAIRIVPMDAHESPLPDVFSQAYASYLQELEEGYKTHHVKPTSGFEAYQQKHEILEKKIEFCNHEFLDPKNDPTATSLMENWAAVKDGVEGLNFASFEEWTKFFTTNNPYNIVPETLEWTLSIPSLVNHAEHFGYFNAELDIDGTIRKSQLITRTGSNYMPSIALQAFLIATKQHIELKIQSLANLKFIQNMTVTNDEGEAVFDIPASNDGKLLINYAGSRETVPYASIADLLNVEEPSILVTQKVKKSNGKWEDSSQRLLKKDFFKDKILVLGATAIGIFDMRVTPFDENFPGVETHANVIDNLLRRDFLSRSTYEELYMPVLMLILGLIISIALSQFGALYGLLFAVGLVLLMGFFDRQFLFMQGKLVSIILPLFQVMFTYMFLTFYKYLTEERSKKELRATFSKYVSPAIVEEILQDPKNLELGGRKERVTVFFSDVRGFTTISEKLDPRALSDLLNSYLTPMTELVFKNQGTLDKYMGDAIMAFFGAPVHYAEHAKMACRCALENLEKLKELQAIYEKKNLPMIDIGIGLNTGECSVGNMGSETVRSYTVMGDAVNLASRLEGINKTYGTHIIISEFTYAEVKDDFVCREVDWVRVKGKLEPVKIYELIAEGKSSEAITSMVKNFNDGYMHYHQRRFDSAIQSFTRAIEFNKADDTSKIYIERCQEFIHEPPPDNWDGVYVMKTK